MTIWQQQECPLCGCPYGETTAADWKDHIAHHLEQFALLVIRVGEQEVSADQEPDGQDASSISYGTAKSDSSLLSSDDDDGDDGVASLDYYSSGKRHHGRSSEHLWEAKITKYLALQLEDRSEPAWLDVPKCSPGFVGRQGDLRRLRECLAQPGHICVVGGREGAVIWLGAGSTSDSLIDRYNSIGRRLFGLGQPEDGRPGDALGLMLAVRGKLECWDKRWILIFDNVDAWQDISRYVPRGLPRMAGSILITTRRPPLIRETRALQRVLYRIQLEPMTPEEGGRLLLRSAGSIGPGVAPHDSCHADAKVAIQLAELVGRLPLALVMMGSYVKARQVTLAGFLEMWEEKSEQAKRRRRVPEATKVMAFLDPERIQRDLLADAEAAAITCRGMIGLLSRWGLIEVSRDDGGGIEAYRMHRQLQRNVVLDDVVLDVDDVVLDVDDDGLRFGRAMKGATLLIRKRFPGSPATQAPAPQNWPACKEYMPHVIHLRQAYQGALENAPSFERTRELAGLFYDAGFYVWDSQAFAVQDGLAFLDAAEKVLDDLGLDGGGEAARRADIHCISGLLQNAAGCRQRPDSLQRLEKALDIRKHVYETHAYNMVHDVLLRNAAVDYAISLLNHYRFDEAETVLNGCLERYRIWGGRERNPV
ncbi:hypothetical protein B0H67DRAFT_650574 [Lasiosphaeris hirsuta]|uniref:Uncharacterized protein n=1 Tax=Lasiosphaeris hirsuta TaxID=260670 RepID=A0AA40DF26_9PEZI|nr:hypothetical protein B0H67DRAFT_650574 [Lasiosphaeris hirsuta]